MTLNFNIGVRQTQDMLEGVSMDVYVARQPIFDKNLNVFGYELLYRRTVNNYYEGTSDEQATAELINNAFLALHFNELTNGKRAFINFSEEMLLKEIPFMLPADSIVVEILERVQSSDELLEVCRKMKENNYIVALDDFVFQESFASIIDMVDIIKLEFNTLPEFEQRYMLQRYKGDVKFLAEKVETREDFQKALDMGYDYFQGYFFSKPLILKGKDIQSFNGNLVRVIREMESRNPDFQKIADVIEVDVGLSYKLLRLANSAFFGAREEIQSIKSALVRLGTDEIRKWVYIMMLKDVQRVENNEIIKFSLIRAKLMELISSENKKKNSHLEFFMTGLFSNIDVLLGKKMEDVIDELPLTSEISDALTGKMNELGEYLALVRLLEDANWNAYESDCDLLGIDRYRLMELYFESLRWVVSLDYD